MAPMPNRRTLTILLAAAAVSLGAAAPANAVIVPQDNIAGVKVDMTQEKVLEVLGDPLKTITRRGGPGGEDIITTYTYKRKGLKVNFQPNKANTHNTVTSITVYRTRKQKTAEGIGLGSTRRAVKTKLAGSKCKRLDPTYAVCWIGKSKIGEIVTSFRLNKRNKVSEIYLARILYH